jgi:hypothetical protein
MAAAVVIETDMDIAALRIAHTGCARFYNCSYNYGTCTLHCQHNYFVPSEPLSPHSQHLLLYFKDRTNTNIEMHQSVSGNGLDDRSPIPVEYHVQNVSGTHWVLWAPPPGVDLNSAGNYRWRMGTWSFNPTPMHRHTWYGESTISFPVCLTLWPDKWLLRGTEFRLGQLVKKFRPFVEPEGPLLCPQGPATGSHPQPVEKVHSYHTIAFHFNIVLPSTLQVFD